MLSASQELYLMITLNKYYTYAIPLPTPIGVDGRGSCIVNYQFTGW